GNSDNHLHSLCHGVITLSRLTLDFGAARRRLQVQKLRGVDFIAGFHDFVIRRGGLDIFPRLVAAEHEIEYSNECRGEKVTVYQFDERIDTLLARAEAMGLNLRACIDKGQLVVRQIDPAEISPGEFAANVIKEVQQRSIKILMIDSLSGYVAAMPQEQ
ncbi:AAA family ATPase, partial [Aduncisulcus paluster]